MLPRNEWTFSGEVFYIKDLDNCEFAVSLKLRGVSQRPESMSTQIVELSCLGDKNFKSELNKFDLKSHSNLVVSGHIETWFNNGRQKNMFIADYVFEDE